jgi:cytochrome c oxidase cbb3-type subunit 3/ubiquinol-cytochrome c reductase cytochrome c subunit
MLLLAALAAGCDFPGRPVPPVPEDQITDTDRFDALYAMRCAACHGANGKLGPAPPLNDPIFLAIVPDEELVRVIREGRTVTPGQRSPMPAFAHDRGGPLTSAEVKVLAEGIKKRWGPPASPSSSLPAYTGPAAGRTDLKSVPPTGGTKEDSARIARGREAFVRACAGCHGPQGQGHKDGHPLEGGAISNQAFLALISDQALRRTIITGRADLGMPAYDGKTGRSPDFRALTAEEIEELVALLRHWRQRTTDKG